MPKNSLNALIAKGIVARGDKGEQSVTVLLDTGASHSFIARKLAEQLCTLTKLPTPMQIELGDSRLITISESVTLELEFAGLRIIDTFLVSEKMPEEILFGLSTMRKYGIKIDLERGSVFAATKEQPQLEHLQLIESLFKHQEETPMLKVIARLHELFALAAEATEDQILTKVNELYTQSQQLVATKNKVIAVLGVKPETADGEIEGTLSAAVKAQTLRGKVIFALKLDASASDEAIVAAVTTAQGSSGELAKLTAKVTDLEQKDFDRAFNSVIDGAFAAGKILPTQKKDTVWLETQKNFAKANMVEFKSFWDKQPVVGAVQQIVPNEGGATRGEVLTVEDKSVAAAMGVPEADLKKYNSPVVN